VQVGNGGGNTIGGLASTLGGALGIDLGNGADSWKQHIIAIVAECGLAPAIDMVEIDLASAEQAPTVEIGDTISLSLGYTDDSAQAILTGQIEQMRHTIQGGVRLTISNDGASLAKLRLNQSYEQQTAGQIVQDLAQRAEVSTNSIEDGVDFPFYVIDDRRTAYQHIATLARKSGYLAYFTPEGKLNFAPAQEGASVTFTYGVDILALHVTESSPTIASLTTIGEGAAGSQGQSAWSWLIKDPAAVQGSSGSDAPKRLVSDSTLRSQNAAQTAAIALVNAADRTRISGQILVPGSPAVTIGNTIEITNAPAPVLNSTFLVHHLRHHYSKQEGFKTVIEFSKG
jgi:phage protein D